MKAGRLAPEGSLQLKRAAFIVAAAWTAAVVLGAAWNLREAYKHTMDSARAQALQSFEKDLVYRRWAATHGGVYVPITEETPPNPYLLGVEDRDITTPSGVELTLMNPAYMTRQVHELGRRQYGHQGHITSLDPLRPENAADPWETAALRAFERGETEVVERAAIGDTEYLRLMRPLITEATCLKCHAAQGYELGDVRGGISVSVPMAPLWEPVYRHMAVSTIGYGLIGLLGLAGIGFSTSRMGRRIRERDRAHDRVAESARSLRGLAVRLQSVREDERAAMARQVHDEVGDALASLRMDLSWLYERLPADAQGPRERAASSLHLADETIAKVRRLWAGLRPPILDDLGAVAAIEWYAQEFTRRTGIACELDMEAAALDLDDAQATAVFRVAEEALTNVARHADADRCGVSLHLLDGQLVLRVIDDGKGIDEQDVGDEGSLGLLEMRERALAVGGGVEVRPIPEGGTEVTLSFRPRPEMNRRDSSR